MVSSDGFGNCHDCIVLVVGIFFKGFFKTTNKRTDLSRFLIYDARLYESIRNSVDDNVRIRTIVIYGPNTGNPKSSIDAGSFSYNVEHIFLSKMDGENIFHSLYGKIESGENLTETEKVSLILSPLMDIKKRGN